MKNVKTIIMSLIICGLLGSTAYTNIKLKLYSNEVSELKTVIYNNSEIITALTNENENLKMLNATLLAKNDELIKENDEYKNKYSVDYFKFPLPDEYKNNLTSKAGYRNNAALNTGGSSLQSHLHFGDDYSCPDKTPVVASRDGVVRVVFPGYYNGSKWKGDPVYGGMIIIEHEDGWGTLYGHLSRTDVKEGTVIKAGEQIGLSGGVKGRRASGSTTGPHLHFTIIPNIRSMFSEYF